MKKTGAFLLTYALEQIGVRHTFGIPGVHNTEIYDELNKSEKITPVLVTHEGGGAFMADGVSRTSDRIGTCVIVPAAGTTNAMSGVGEAFLDGIPLLVISGGTRRDSGRSYQLHQLDQGRLLDGIIKKYYLISTHEEIIPTLYEAYRTAVGGEPGPVFIEIPVEIQLFRGNVDELPAFVPEGAKTVVDREAIKKAVDLLTQAKSPGIYAGWGGVGAAEEIQRIAEQIAAPVATTLQGKSVIPGNHPLHTGVGFGDAAVPVARKAFKQCDCMLAIGCRFAELATGSFGVRVPENLIHIDINPEVFHKNFPAKVAIEGDAGQVLQVLLEELQNRNFQPERKLEEVAAGIQEEKAKYDAEWRTKRQEEKVSPGFFFQSLRSQLADDALMVVDDGKHTFLAAELFPVHRPGHFISPTDFNCMGYCVPAAIGAKLSNPHKQVAAIVGDGAFLMTGMEMLTAVTYKLGIVYYVFHDGELGQISQFQKIPLNRKTCTTIGEVQFEGMAIATGAAYLAMRNDGEIEAVIRRAMEIADAGRPVLVDVNVDYSKKTCLTKGAVKANLSRFPTAEKVRFIGRAIKRQILG